MSVGEKNWDIKRYILFKSAIGIQSEVQNASSDLQAEIKIQDKLHTCQVIERPGENDSFKLPRIILYGARKRRPELF